MNSFGEKFRVSIFGESHGKAIGVIIDGVPAGIPLNSNDFKKDLARRKSGKKGTTQRIEDDIPQIISGIYDGCTTGAPLTIIFENHNANSGDYSEFREIPRPGHADFAASIKYNFYNDIRGGGHFSGRVTLCLVAAGVVAKKLISPIGIEASITELGGIPFKKTPNTEKKKGLAFKSNNDKITSPKLGTGYKEWDDLLENIMSTGDSIGGIIECTCNNVPIGIGEPFFNSVESEISHLAFSVPGIRGIEFGDGFKASAMKGSEHNDRYIDKEGKTATNHAGGINGGISNGNPITFRVAVKPTSSIAKKQKAITL
jgi:chorismate synthase